MPEEKPPEYWPYRKGKTISRNNGSKYRQEHQQDAHGILRSVRIGADEMEYFIFEDDDPQNTNNFLGDVKDQKLDFDYAQIRIPQGVKNVKYTVYNNGILDSLKTEVDQGDDFNGFLGTVLFDFRKSDEEIYPYARKEEPLHHCDPGQCGRHICTKLLSYGFNENFHKYQPEGQPPLPVNNWGRIKILYTDNTTIGSDIGVDDRTMDCKDGFYFVPVVMQEKVVVYVVLENSIKGIRIEQNGVKKIKQLSIIEQFNLIFFNEIVAAKGKAQSNTTLFMASENPVIRDDGRSILFLKAFEIEQDKELGQDYYQQLIFLKI